MIMIILMIMIMMMMIMMIMMMIHNSTWFYDIPLSTNSVLMVYNSRSEIHVLMKGTKLTSFYCINHIFRLIS